MDFSDYIVYVDESGDHSLTSIDSEYPVFVLAFCIFNKKCYAEKILPDFKELKFHFFGHDVVVLHEREIRKQAGVFSLLVDRVRRNQFMQFLNEKMEKAEFTVIATVIDKQNLCNSYQAPDNPYHIALKFCMERLFYFLQAHNQQKRITHIVVEKRGGKAGGGVEDKELELEFRRIVQGENGLKKEFPFELIFAHKQCNSTGLQLADLVARPIGIHLLRPEQENRAYDIITRKFYTKAGKVDGFGLKYFPQKSEKAPV